MECAAVDTLVKLTKGNVDASQSTIFPAQNWHTRLLPLIPNKVSWFIGHVIGCLNIKLERAFQSIDLLPYKREVEVSLLYGTHKADCTKRYWRETASNGKRKEGSKEEPSPREKRGHEGGVGVLF